MKLKCGLASCSALNIPVVWQWRRWWRWWAKTLSLSPPWALVSPPPWLSRTQTALRTVEPPPLLPARTPWTYSKNRAADLQYCPWNWREKLSLYLSVCVSVCRPPYHNCTPRDCSERLPFWWTSSFFLFFFKWPYLSLKMWHLGTMRGGNVLVFQLSVYLLLSGVLSSRHHFVTEDTGHLLFSAFSWWSLYYVKASVP